MEIRRSVDSQKFGFLRTLRIVFVSLITIMVDQYYRLQCLVEC
jgi:hypothetical protein